MLDPRPEARLAYPDAAATLVFKKSSVALSWRGTDAAVVDGVVVQVLVEPVDGFPILSKIDLRDWVGGHGFVCRRVCRRWNMNMLF